MSLLSRAENLSESEYRTLLSRLSDVYYNGVADESDSEYVISDSEYDTLLAIYQTRFGKPLQIGAPVRDGESRLEVAMASLDKVKTQSEIDSRISRYPGEYVRSDKIDGVSLQYNGKTLKTRGNGIVGKDVTRYLSLIPDIPAMNREGAFVRGDIVMPRSTFNSDYKNQFSNPRNMVIGLLNPTSKTSDKTAIKHLHFIAHEYYDGQPRSKIEEYRILTDLGFRVPDYAVVREFRVENMTAVFENRRRESNYDVDGDVYWHNAPHQLPEPGVNPDYAFAFKVLGECKPTRVLGVEWNASRYGYLKPTLVLQKINLSGIDIDRTSAFNAKFIVDNKLGKDAVVEMTRSGDVIPHIVRVLSPAVKADLPDVKYKWNESGVEILEVVESEATVCGKIEYFFRTMGAKHLGDKTILKLYRGGFTTIKSLLTATLEGLMKVDGVGKSGAERMLSEIARCREPTPVYRIAVASGVFPKGVGESRMKSVFQRYPDVLERYKRGENLVELLQTVEGIKTVAGDITIGIPDFIRFLETNPVVAEFAQPAQSVSQQKSQSFGKSIAGLKIVFTGGKDEAVEREIEARGGKVTTSVSSKTGLVVTAQRYSGSSKEIKADSLQIPVLTMTEFKKEYGF
jgi:DNA ligase (NAD+)